MISGVIPVRDGARYLGAAIASLRDQVDELIVVDDGSATPVAAPAGVTVLRTPPRGPGAARNAGARAAAGDRVAFLDADDLAVPDRIERQRQASEDMVFGGVRAFASPDRPGLTAEVPEGIRFTPHAGGMLVRREAFLATGGFDATVAPAEFVEWIDRARAAGLTERMLDVIVLERRVHGGNLTLRADREAYARAARAAILRRRSGT